VIELSGFSRALVAAVFRLWKPTQAVLSVTGLIHRQSYKDIFFVTCLKTLAVFVVTAAYYLTGIV
jgi:hypothetical protein